MRIEEFTHSGRNFIYFDLTDMKRNDEFDKLIEESRQYITKHPEQSLYAISNITNVRFDSKTKEMAAKWMEQNKPYIKYGVVIGLDGIKKIMVNSVLSMSNRKNVSFASSKESAIEWLLKQD